MYDAENRMRGILDDYAPALDLLDDYDHQSIVRPIGMFKGKCSVSDDPNYLDDEIAEMFGLADLAERIPRGEG